MCFNLPDANSADLERIKRVIWVRNHPVRAQVRAVRHNLTVAAGQPGVKVPLPYDFAPLLRFVFDSAIIAFGRSLRRLSEKLVNAWHILKGH